MEYDAFRDLISNTNPLVKIMVRNTLKGEIMELYQAEKAKAMALLENNDSWVAITRLLLIKRRGIWLLRDISWKSLGSCKVEF